MSNQFTMPGGTPYEFQLEGVRFINAHHGNAIIGDQRGVGKTLQALIWLYVRPNLRPALIVVPAQVKPQWKRQTAKWLGIPEDSITVLKGRTPRDLSESQLIIVNYDILSAWQTELARIQPKVLILDECHRVKTAKATRSKAAAFLSSLDSIQSRVGLTGTMFLNRPKEGWHQTHVINPQVFPTEWPYLMKYCNPKKVHTTAQRDSEGKVLRDSSGEPVWNTSWDFNGASKVDELANVLRAQVLIRRLKQDVFGQLPPIQRVTVPLECNLTDYRLIQKEVKKRLKEIKQELANRRQGWEDLAGQARQKAIAKDAEGDSLIKLYGLAGAEIAKLRKAAGLAKVKPASEWLEDFVVEQVPVLLFAHHHEVQDNLVSKLNEDYECQVPPALDGRMSMANREKHTQLFVNKQVPFLVAGLTAMSEGFDGLQHAASHLAFVELGWGPGVHDQAEGRLDRTGQTSPVTSYYLVATNTIDENLARIIDAKGVVTSAAHGDDMPDPGILESLMDWIIGE